MAQDGSSRLKGLLQWFKEQRIEFKHVDIKAFSQQYSGDALGVFATCNISERTTIASIPKEAILSVKNTSICELLEEKKIGGGLGLVIAVMYEAALGERSKWSGYLQSLPPREYIPLFWPDLAVIEGTEAEVQAKQARHDTQADYKEEVEPLLAEDRGSVFDSTKMSLEHFRTAASWIGSRAFGVDDYHGMSMVPFADLFNHKASIVSLTPEYVLEGACLAPTDAKSGRDDGSDSDQASDSEEEAGSEEGFDNRDTQDGQGPNEHVLWPAICNASTRGDLVDPSSFPDQDLRLNIGICGIEKEDESFLEIVAAMPLRECQEIFNTFGELGNADLLCKYGFTLPDNPFSSVQLSKDHYCSVVTERLGSDAFQERAAYVEEQSNLLDPEEEPFEVLPHGYIGPALLAAACIMGCSDEDWRAVKKLDIQVALREILGPQLMSMSSQQQSTHNADECLTGTKRKRLDSEDAEQFAAGTQEPSTSGTDVGDNFDIGAVRIENATGRLIPEQVSKDLLSSVQLRSQCLERHGSLQTVQGKLNRALQVPSRDEEAAANIAALTLIVDEMTILETAANALRDRSYS